MKHDSIEIRMEEYEELIEYKNELEVYKKAYNLLSKAYCDKGACWTRCECNEQCSIHLRYGGDITKEFFLEKAREDKE